MIEIEYFRAAWNQFWIDFQIKEYENHFTNEKILGFIVFLSFFMEKYFEKRLKKDLFD